MRTVDQGLLVSPLPPARRLSPNMSNGRLGSVAHKFELSDYLLLTGVALVPFVAPMPGPSPGTPTGWQERVTVADGFFVLAMLLAGFQRAKQLASDWLNRRPQGFSTLPAPSGSTWLVPPMSPIWFC